VRIGYIFLRIRTMAGPCEHGGRLSCFTSDLEFID